MTPPSPPSPEAQRAPAPLPVHASSRAYRVMVVEDNEDIRQMMKDLLEAKGHEALVACDGPSGLEAVLALRPDIAFIDIGLPGLNGYEVAEALRSRAPDL